MILRYPGMTLEQAMKLLSEADLYYQAGAPETLGVSVTVTDKAGPGTEDRQAELRMRQPRRAEALTRQAEPGLEDLEADPEAMAEGDKILRGQGEAVPGKPLGPREERGE
jgi:hypothetical protein